MKRIVLAALIPMVWSVGCQDQQPKDAGPVLLDSLAEQVWDRDISTGRAVPISGQRNPLPSRLYRGTAQDFIDDSVYFSEVSRKLRGIDASTLPEKSKVDLDLLLWTAQMRTEAVRHFGNTFPLITPYSSQLSPVGLVFTQATIRSGADADRYLDLLEQYVEVQKVDRARLKNMEARGIRLPKPEIELTLGLIRSLRSSPEQHPYFPAASRMEELDSVKRKEFAAKSLKILSERIFPEYDSLADYLKGDYSSKATDQVGSGQYPGGKDYYHYLVRTHTTTDMSPEEIHEMGKKLVDRITERLDSIRMATHFPGDMKAFYSFLRTDKRFLASTPEEVADRLKMPLKRMDTAIHRLISLRPREGYDIRRLPLALEPAMTFGNYLPPSGDQPLGIYYYNGSNLSQRPLTSAAALAFHEIMPGHHWQACLQAGNKNLSRFRQNQTVTAYTEGWGEYASYLGLELGLYDDPYDLCGRLLMDMFISVRLVVDVGMNELGWSREKAMAYMREHVIESDEQIRTETIRYSCDIPGQALAYKIGALKLIALRNKYQVNLGTKFDQVHFHDVILLNGNLPLSVLEKALDREFLR